MNETELVTRLDFEVVPAKETVWGEFFSVKLNCYYGKDDVLVGQFIQGTLP